MSIAPKERSELIRGPQEIVANSQEDLDFT